MGFKSRLKNQSLILAVFFLCSLNLPALQVGFGPGGDSPQSPQETGKDSGQSKIKVNLDWSRDPLEEQLATNLIQSKVVLITTTHFGKKAYGLLAIGTDLNNTGLKARLFGPDSRKKNEWTIANWNSGKFLLSVEAVVSSNMETAYIYYSVADSIAENGLVELFITSMNDEGVIVEPVKIDESTFESTTATIGPLSLIINVQAKLIPSEEGNIFIIYNIFEDPLHSSIKAQGYSAELKPLWGDVPVVVSQTETDIEADRRTEPVGLVNQSNNSLDITYHRDTKTEFFDPAITMDFYLQRIDLTDGTRLIGTDATDTGTAIHEDITLGERSMEVLSGKSIIIYEDDQFFESYIKIKYYDPASESFSDSITIDIVDDTFEGLLATYKTANDELVVYYRRFEDAFTSAFQLAVQVISLNGDTLQRKKDEGYSAISGFTNSLRFDHNPIKDAGPYDSIIIYASETGNIQSARINNLNDDGGVEIQYKDRDLLITGGAGNVQFLKGLTIGTQIAFAYAHVLGETVIQMFDPQTGFPGNHLPAPSNFRVSPAGSASEANFTWEKPEDSEGSQLLQALILQDPSGFITVGEWEFVTTADNSFSGEYEEESLLYGANSTHIIDSDNGIHAFSEATAEERELATESSNISESGSGRSGTKKRIIRARCFIATSTYQNLHSRGLNKLTTFRDNSLILPFSYITYENIAPKISGIESIQAKTARPFLNTLTFIIELPITEGFIPAIIILLAMRILSPRSRTGNLNH